MALEQTLFSGSAKLQLPKPNPSLTTSFTPPFSFSTFSTTTNWNNKLNLKSRVTKCSYEHSATSNNTNNEVQYPRPTEVEWKKEACNTVHLTGMVAVPVQIKHLPSGKVVASSRIGVKTSQTQTMWINLTFWEELAHIAAQHLEKGQQIYVTGKLVSDTTEDGEGKQQTFYKIVVQQLNFVERSFPSGGMNTGDSNSSSPGKKPSINHTGSMEELWQAFFANPLEWWDNRKNKRSPNYPDFKHKDTGEALWAEGRTNPTWVKSQLSELDSKMGSLHGQNASSLANFMSADNFQPF